MGPGHSSSNTVHVGQHGPSVRRNEAKSSRAGFSPLPGAAGSDMAMPLAKSGQTGVGHSTSAVPIRQPRSNAEPDPADDPRSWWDASRTAVTGVGCPSNRASRGAAGRWISVGYLAGAVTLDALRSALAGTARSPLPPFRCPLLGRLLMRGDGLHLAIDALTLQLLLERPQRLVERCCRARWFA